MPKAFSSTKLSDTLTISRCVDGYWLYDATRGMNLSMCAKTAEEAFAEALTYYQERLKKVESELSSLQSKVDSFLSQFREDEE